MIADQAEIYVRAGNGGHGCVSFRREKYIPKGGPDGGDGGDGGHVYAVARHHVETLLDFNSRHHWVAGNGQPGMGKQMTGRGGDDIVLELPLGTLIYDRDSDVLIKDLNEPDEPVRLVEGGKGGRGNVHFKRADHQVPREAEPGTPGQERWLRLELKLMADVGLVGLPNAGKSTLLSRLSKAHPRIAGYPFTTLKPQLGICELPGHRRFVMADIPGLIEGAHQGAGLGDAFLKHIERTRMILHVIDVGDPHAATDPAKAYHTIRHELSQYSPHLAGKEEIIVANKIDITDGDIGATLLAEEIGKPVFQISAVAGTGLTQLAEAVWSTLHEEEEPEEPEPELPQPPHRRPE